MKKQSHPLFRLAILVYLFTVLLWVASADAGEDRGPLQNISLFSPSSNS